MNRILSSIAILWAASVGCVGHPQLVQDARGGQNASVESETEATMQNEKPQAGLSALGEQHRAAAEKIIAATLAGNDAYEKLETLCLDIGPRLSGSEALDGAIEWAVGALEADGHEDVRTEKVMVPKWVRGKESVTMLSPRRAPLSMLGLGGSVGTPSEGITAEVVAVVDEAGLEALGKQGVTGKVVLFNNPMPAYSHEKGTGYGKTVRFRVRGADMASELGAVAVLVRSVTAHSLDTPHTGMLRYSGKQTKIPAAAVSVEAAETLARLVRRGHKVSVNLKMEARSMGMVPSANVLAELRGRDRPEEIVVISGHLDSWDVGHGAHDDGAGVVIAMEALSVLRRLDLRPSRTVRVVLWTNEENGMMGGKTYAREHADELPLHAAAIESDSGGFDPVAIGTRIKDADKQARGNAVLEGILPLFAALNTTEVMPGASGADISPMLPGGVPLLGLVSKPDVYFDYHHTPADTIDKVDEDELSRSVAAMAVLAYILAEMPGRLGD